MPTLSVTRQIALILLLFSSSACAQRVENNTRVSVINPELVTPDPIDQAKRLYNFLKDTYKKNIISGVMTLNSMDEVDWLKANTGKEPALVGLDFMHCNRGYDWYNDQEPINDARTYYNRNGIPAICWHWRDPSRVTEEFYTNKTSFDVSRINDPASAEYQAMISDIDYVSGLLKILNDEGIPVIWRPLHEAAGGWFWWGAKGAAPCKKLYQVMFDRMVNHHGLKNLIWVWTHEPNDNAWYPGDEYVDIVGRDLYRDGDHSSQLSEYTNMVNLYGAKKMIGLSETGSFPDVDNLINDKAGWLWYMPWYGKYTREATYNPLSLWQKMFAHSYVITLDEMPDLKTYVSPIVTAAETTTEKNVRIYPTLITENTIVVEGSTVLGSVSIYNNMGQKVREFLNLRLRERLFLDLKPGLYFIKPEKSSTATKVVIR